MTNTLFELATAASAPSAQWRLAEVQLANWGTFDGAIYRIPIARRGHLITGPSGSGKSSLLDAIAAVLTPDKWLRFNAAAQGAGQRAGQRNIPSYVRGAWSRAADDDEDRIVSRFLRDGATWSGILLRYTNDVDTPVTLARLFFLRGTATASTDLNDLCLLERSVLDLRDLEPFARSGIETRKIQGQWPDAIVTSNGSHGRFYARMRSLFGIANETALQLLHKTQSAKNLDSLDQLFREYMLERPRTFDLADTAVEQFGELRDAHDHVVQLRLQRDHLVELRTASEAFDRSNDAATAAGILADGVGTFQRRRSLALAREELTDARERLGALTAEAHRLTETRQRADEDFEIAQRRSVELGGGDAGQLQHRIRTAQEAAEATTERWASLHRRLQDVGIAHTPTSAAEFSELIVEIDRILTTNQNPVGASHAEHARHAGAAANLERIEREIRALRTSGTTVPENLLDVRAELAAATDLPLSAIPFAAELLEVRPEFADWSGAIERVLRPLALTMLVRSEHLPRVRRWVDAHRVPVRLVFEEVTSSPTPPRPASSDQSLLQRVTVAEGAFTPWLAGILSERFDFACVDDPDELDKHARAVTISGQQKTSRTRYEKDDRIRIDDRSSWVLGDREAKLEALIALLREAETERDAAREILDRAEAARSVALRREGALKAIRDQRWRDLDQAAAAAEVNALQRQLEELTRADGDLRAAVAAEESARSAQRAAADASEQARVLVRQEQQKHDELIEVVAAFEAGFASASFGEIDDATESLLAARFRAIQRRVTRQNIADVAQDVLRQLQLEWEGARTLANEASTRIATLAAQFKERWNSSAADLTPSIADRQGYLRMLDEIIAHGLPDHEARFLTLLRERSRDLIGELISDVLGAPQEIADRVVPVNASLRRSKFDEGRFLHLRVKPRRSDTVSRFIADLRSIAADGWGDDTPERAETRFATLAELMRKFASSEHADRTWKAQCLDTRLHVTFIADEVDAHGRVHASYDSGVAMSGGQQQKLVVFCLAAALRYQLADPDEALSRYGTVILDEAFDKADTRYTRMALDVFVEFGFQLVLATPQKLLQTIEPYVGAATSIENPTRQRSDVANVSWDEASR